MNNPQGKISIIVCTYNRAELLKECLQSFVEQSLSADFFEVLVVNNNSNDHTVEVVEEFIKTQSNFRLETETSTGLSYARNKGSQQAKYDWISYVDDDAKAHQNYVERALQTIENYGYECFGGVYLPWYKYGSANWLPQNSLSNLPQKPDESVQVITSVNACGGVIVFNKKALEDVGGFPVHLGMTGEKIAYGEEDAVQQKMRDKGYTIGLDQGLRIDHLVAKYKLDWRWHIQAAYAHGLAEIEVNQVVIKQPFVFLIVGCFVLPLVKMPYLLAKVLFKKRYYWQNMLIDLFGEARHYKGRYDGFTKKKNEDEQ